MDEIKNAQKIKPQAPKPKPRHTEKTVLVAKPVKTELPVQ